MDWSLVVSFGSLVVAGVALWHTIGTRSRLERTAGVTAYFYYEQLRNATSGLPFDVDHLILHNRGPAEARNVDIELSSDGSGPPPELNRRGVPIEVLDADGKHYMNVVFGGDLSLTCKATLSWEDGRGTHRKIITLGAR